jgi:hypothetical protein
MGTQMAAVTQNQTLIVRCREKAFGQVDMPADVKSKASPDYERPDLNVADMPDPVTLPANKARQGVPVRGMWLVLTVGTALAAFAMLFAYLVLWRA